MKKILVIEDNFEVRDNLCEILELANYEVFSAKNGKEGIQQALKHLPDLILCDVMMPELDGFGALKILNQNIKARGIPFIFLTAKTEKADFRKGMGLGADDYITKPFDDTELLESIEIRLAKNERLRSVFDESEKGLQRFFSEAKAKEGLQRFSEDREVRTYSKKDYLYEEGTIPRWLFFVVSGQVKTFQTNEFGKNLTTKLYTSGEFVGYFPLLNDGRYIDSAMTIEKSEIRLIPKEDFKLLMFNNRDVAAQFIKIMARQAGSIEQQLVEFAYSSVRRKVALALLHHSKKQNSFKVTREELAASAGTAKETLIRTLSDFKSEGLIQIEDYHTIKILNKTTLKEMPQ